MAKSKKQSSENMVRHPVLIAAVLVYFGLSLNDSTNSALSSLTNSAFTIIGLLVACLGIEIYWNRKTITHSQILRFIVIYVAIFSVIFGLKLCSYTDSPLLVQNDGYNVTGGFLTMFGGYLGGFIYAKEKWIGRGKK